MAITNEELESNIQVFFDKWSFEEMNDLARFFLEFLEVFELDKEMDWEKEVIANEDVRNVKIIRCMYIVLKMADLYAGKLVATKVEFKSLWRKLEALE
jgi:predicted KAP-like P-loop ATPase